jgi:isoleucyl-tRNA synthetase
MSQEKSYRDTLNLPETSFAMKANLVQREPQMRKHWASENIYTQIREARMDAPQYILHDGPPYANGDIHMGHVINKVLKDFVIKYKTMMGFDAPYVPGWDCHGLPIESKVMTALGEKARQMPKAEIRRECMKYASKYVKLQSKQFQELGIFGDFENPYLTFKPQYEAGVLEVFAEMVGKGLVYKQLKPIHWCVGCETALAEAELEYKDISSPSIFVNFPATPESITRLVEFGLVSSEQAKDAAVCFMIWTTTPWTLAANLAIAVHPQLDYTTIDYRKDGRRYVSVVSTDRIEAVVKAGRLEEGKYSVSGKKVRGGELESLRYQHPFIEKNPTDRDAYLVLLAEYVTTEDGTGLVHTAPGHGQEDYVSGQKYGLAVYSPVQDDGTYDETAPDWLRGKSVMSVEKEINDYLAQHGWLFAQSQIAHSYPHCWRSRDPVIFRATEQWFIAVDKEIPECVKTLRQLAMESCDRVRWIPSWGQKRIAGMLESRPDWCISRQRSWGLPIPAFVMPDGRWLLTKESVLAVAEYVGKRGSDTWFTDSPRQILGANFPLPEGFNLDELQKEENIFDVWFESGCSWYSVAAKQGWDVPVDLYLEGSDQHRGWFQLSLLPALGAIGQEPFKSVLTHGFTVDEKGMKQSKSLGNYVVAQEEVARYGADVLRLWVSSVNYQEDIRCNDEIIGRTQDAYRKIRNTLRYLLGNIDDFEPAIHTTAYEQMPQIDQWAMQQLQRLIVEVHDAYENFVFHRVFSLLHNFCTVEMSSIYMDVLKDRMYCDATNSLSRRSGQTVMYETLCALVRLLAPILVHTAEEAWDAMTFKPEDSQSIHLATMPKADPAIDYTSQGPKWQKIMQLRDQALLALDGLRRNKVINSSQEARVSFSCTDEDAAALEAFGLPAFAALCIVSEVTVSRGASETTVTAEKSPNAKCQRCWNYWPTIGEDKEHPTICQRCASIVRGGD